MKKKLAALLLLGGIILDSGIVVGIGPETENKGSEIILLEGGKMRNVHFPHHRHQNALGDCNICHNLFPRKTGGIKELKGQGKLKKKQVMREHCIDCHKKMKDEGRKTGPTSCAGCHRESS